MASLRNPGRPRSFDEAEILTKAMQVFWAKGFAGASFADLEAATGLHRQSLVYAFGDKRALFARALAHYAEGRVTALTEALAAGPTPMQGLERALALWAAEAADSARRGCLMVKTLDFSEEAGPEAGRALEVAYADLVEAFSSAFSAAQATGEMRADLSPQTLATGIVALADGLVLHSTAPCLGADAAAVFAAILKTLRP